MHGLDKWIIEEQEKAIRYLEANSFTFNEIKGFYWKKLQFKGKVIYLRVVLPKQFPLEYPKFYVNQEEWYLLYPHIEKSKKYGVNICYIEDKDKMPIFDGAKLIEKELNNIYKIIKSYEKGFFKEQDFLEEFDSYWGETSIYMDVQSVIKEPKILDLLEVQKFKEVVTTDINKTKEALNNLGLEIYKKKKIIFLPFFDKFTYPFPKTKRDIFKIINSLSYKPFLDENVEQTGLKVVFSFKIDDHIHYGAFKFTEPYNQFMINPEIIPIKIKRIDRDRIFSRGGNEVTQDISKAQIEITIVGCGSLGASLAFKLAKSGVKRFVFIDPDILTEANIGRHICGMKYINWFKVNALKDFLLDQFPDLEIEAIPKNGIECFEKLSQTNLIVSAVGSEGERFEQLLLQLKHSKNQEIFIPDVILTWFEGPVGGQIVLVKNTDINDFPMFLKNITILDESKKSSLIKLDIGCNNSYSPYAFIDAENTVLHVSLMITEYIVSFGRTDEIIYTVFNDTKKYNDYLAEKYKKISPYTIKKQKLKDLL